MAPNQVCALSELCALGRTVGRAYKSPIRAWPPLGKAQRIEEATYEPLLRISAVTHPACGDGHASVPSRGRR